MSLVDWSVIIMGAWVVVVLLAGLAMAFGSGPSELIYVDEPGAIALRQTAGIMPKRAWGFRPPVRHSHYEPAPWQVRLPKSEEDSLDNMDRATDIKRELGSEHPPWERLDRQGL